MPFLTALFESAALPILPPFRFQILSPRDMFTSPFTVGITSRGVEG